MTPSRKSGLITLIKQAMKVKAVAKILEVIRGPFCVNYQSTQVILVLTQSNSLKKYAYDIIY
jgi:hypothetical protein